MKFITPEPTPVIMVDNLPLMKDRPAFLIAYLWTPPSIRGQGLMRKLITDFISASDRDIWMKFAPDTNDGTDPQRLLEFYESMGFTRLDDSDILVYVKLEGEDE